MGKISGNTSNINIDDDKPVKKTTRRTSSRTAAKEAEKITQVFDENKEKLDREKKLVRSIKSKKRLIVENYGKQVSEELIAEKLINILKENEFQGDIKTLNIYYKVEEETAYCVVNQGEPIVVRINE